MNKHSRLLFIFYRPAFSRYPLCGLNKTNPQMSCWLIIHIIKVHDVMNVTKDDQGMALPCTASKLVLCLPCPKSQNHNKGPYLESQRKVTPSALMLAFAKASEAVSRACANVSAHQMQHWEIGQSFCDVNSLSTDQGMNLIPTATLENYYSLFFVESGPQRFGDATFSSRNLSATGMTVKRP